MTCPSGKTSYRTKSKAKDVCKTLKGLGKGNLNKVPNGTLVPYECKLCGNYHITSMGKLPGRDIIRG